MGEIAIVTTCRVCGTGIEATGKGRPAVYCGTGCRRMAEYDVRRINNTITELEREARSLRNPATLKLPTDEAHAAFLAAEIAAARGRLRELLADDTLPRGLVV
jgi:hypothetical protein